MKSSRWKKGSTKRLMAHKVSKCPSVIAVSCKATSLQDRLAAHQQQEGRSFILSATVTLPFCSYITKLHRSARIGAHIKNVRIGVCDAGSFTIASSDLPQMYTAARISDACVTFLSFLPKFQVVKQANRRIERSKRDSCTRRLVKYDRFASGKLHAWAALQWLSSLKNKSLKRKKKTSGQQAIKKGNIWKRLWCSVLLDTWNAHDLLGDENHHVLITIRSWLIPSAIGKGNGDLNYTAVLHVLFLSWETHARYVRTQIRAFRNTSRETSMAILIFTHSHTRTQKRENCCIRHLLNQRLR